MILNINSGVGEDLLHVVKAAAADFKKQKKVVTSGRQACGH